MNRQRALAPQLHKLIALSLLTTLVAACGGGGGGGGPSTPAATATISVSPTTITVGQSATLTWASNATCTASGGWTGAQQASGTQDVTPTAAGTATYTLTCTGNSTTGTATNSATLTVNAASAYSVTSLVEDQAGGTARATDPLLTNPWGIVAGPTTPMWVANNHSNTSTLYNGNGTATAVVAHFAAGAGGAAFGVTGIVFNGGTDFSITNGTATAPAAFIFDGEGGKIAGWSATVDVANAITTYTATDGAVYKGLAIANNGAGNFLYAADFANNKIDVFNATFAKQASASFPFADSTLPAGYGPFGIQAITKAGTTRIVVAYAKHDTSNPNDEAPGAGLGVVNVFDTNGVLVKHLVAVGGKLNAPWGVALSPSDFGTLSAALIVGNFGDGKIHGYDFDSGRYLGELGDSAGAAFAVPGLWGLAFGNDAANQPHATLFFAAGTNGEVNGRYGRIDLGATAPTLTDPPAITLVVPAGNLSGTVALQANQTNLVAVTGVQFFLNGTTSLGTVTAAPYTVQWDTTKVANGNVTLRAIATGAAGNVGSSRVLTATVANTAPATTLTQVQTNVFTPRCSGCHNGSNPAGGALPGSMDLRAGSSFASIVSVPSLEQGTLQRVKPGDPDNSYLIHKVEGRAGIGGSQMPLGGPFLDQPTIDQIRSWITSGAPNN
jgi:uncharacterized protein (TIGR03118 family)